PARPGRQRARPRGWLQPRPRCNRGFGRRHHSRGRRADRRDPVRRQGKLPGRQAVHDARAVGEPEHAHLLVPAFGVARAAGAAAGQARSQRAAGSSRAGRQEIRACAGDVKIFETKMKKPIYLDYSATTPVDPRVAAKMIPYLTEHFGNPASRSHAFGWETEKAVEEARDEVAKLVHCDPKELVWTSGATESINLALKGAAHFYKDKGKHLVTVKTEHKATLDTMRELERDGFEVSYLDVKPDGLLDLEAFKASLRPDTILVSVMFVNNEIGVIQDIPAIGEICRSRGIIFH